jgi:adenosine deaminase
MHIEGSIEPQLMLDLAARNGMKLRWGTAEAPRSAYRFTSFQSFFDLYFEGCKVLVTERDFHDVTRAYLRRAHADGGASSSKPGVGRDGVSYNRN